ncbi:MAG TPA: hypothetical protein V6C81_00635 [Planktothrix sp.]|jgi:hypothetical protein
MSTAIDMVRTIAGLVLLASSICFIYLFAPYKPDMFAMLFRPCCLLSLASALALFGVCMIDALFLNSGPRGQAALRALCSFAVLLCAVRNSIWLFNATSNALLAGKGWLEAWPCWTIFLPIFTVASLSFKRSSSSFKP